MQTLVSLRFSFAGSRCFAPSRLFGMLLAVTTLIAVLPQLAAAQADSEEAEELPEPEDITLPTKDGVQLIATYYGSLEGKKAVPVILLHGFKGDRRDFEELALTLQKSGHAVIAPDLRGHGDSTTYTRPGGSAQMTLSASKLRKDDIARMYAPGVGGIPSGDLEAVKRFLMAKNNAGELNIEKLCVVGADMGATVALNWALADWSWPRLAGRGKQGQDVKALVLISPEWAFKGLPITMAINSPIISRELSIMLVCGRGDSSGMRDASRIHSSLEKFRPAPPSDPKEAAEKQDLFFDKPSTSLRGTKILGEKSLGLDRRIAKFIDLRLVQMTMPWVDRGKD